MAYEYKPNYGTAFKNNDKSEDWHGDLKGKIMLPNGALHYLDVYKATDKNGQSYLKFKIGKEVAQQKPQASAQEFAELPDDLPF